MVAKRREGAARREAQQASLGVLEELLRAASIARSIALALVAVEPLEAPASQAVRFLRTERSTFVAFRCQAEADAPAVGCARALDQAGRLEARRGGRTWPAPRRARARRARDAVMPGLVLDRDEQRDLPAGHAERVDLAAKLAGEAQQNGRSRFADRDRIVNYAEPLSNLRISARQAAAANRYGHAMPNPLESLQALGEQVRLQVGEQFDLDFLRRQEPPRPLDELLAELDALPGLESVKEQVRALVAFLRVQARRKDSGLSEVATTQHLVFLGNPGHGQDDGRAAARADVSVDGAASSAASWSRSTAPGSSGSTSG